MIFLKNVLLRIKVCHDLLIDDTMFQRDVNYRLINNPNLRYITVPRKPNIGRIGYQCQEEKLLTE